MKASLLFFFSLCGTLFVALAPSAPPDGRDGTPEKAASDCKPACKKDQTCHCSCNNGFACNPSSPPPNCGSCSCNCI